ncbi:HAMP domain-containing sensor histidine kinase [Clostridiaceae bacterium M8S5]|nr:HAMP domain-containing sensor histidine kinase [Clostridiaceae bacterium M8S5]
MRFSLRYKMTVFLLIIFSVIFAITSIFVSSTINRNNNQIIKEDIAKHSYNISLYLIQYLKSNGISANPKAFAENVSNIGTVLSNKFEERFIIYSNNGNFLFDSIYDNGNVDEIMNSGDDFKAALKKNSAYTLIHNNNKLFVSSCVPLVINHKNVGIIRYFFDYTHINQTSITLIKYINLSLIFAFLCLFIFIFLLSKKITRPIVKLSNATTKIAEGDYNHSIEIKTNDEFEELGDNFNIMKNKIKQQLNELQVERNNLVRMYQYRKLFFDNVTHELKTPLTIISGYCQILNDHDLEDKTFVYSTLGKIINESTRMNTLVLDILNIAKSDSKMKYNFSKHNISNILKDIINDMTIKAKEKGIKISTDIANDITVICDDFRIRQSFANIIDNAIKYTDTNGCISTKLYKKLEYCVITIEDNGIGIDNENLDNLYKPFYRVNKSKRESSGLGLYIVKLIISKHKGTISIDSKKGIGTKVKLKIPLNVYNLTTSI